MTFRDDEFSRLQAALRRANDELEQVNAENAELRERLGVFERLPPKLSWTPGLHVLFLFLVGVFAFTSAFLLGALLFGSG